MKINRLDYVEMDLTFEQIGALIEEYISGVNMFTICNKYCVSENQVHYYVRSNYTYANRIRDPVLIVVQSKINQKEY